MNAKQLFITTFAAEKEAYSAFRNAEAASEKFLTKHPDMTENFNFGYFKHFWNKICVENVLTNAEDPISLDLARYLAQGNKRNKPTAPTFEAPLPTPFVVRTVNTSTITIPDAMFKTYMTNSTIDELHSDDGGAMAACSVVVVGGPGVGKSTLLFWKAARFKEVHPEAKIAVISSEMEIEDLLYEARKKPWMNSVDFILTSEYQEQLKDALMTIFLGGYHIIILDSFADICDKLRDFCGMTTSAAETWLLDLMKKAKGGGNSLVLAEKVYTLTFAIQQQTKSGSFSGSNKLKHNTTAMLELRREKNGDRYMVYTKNRRNGAMVGKRLFYYLGSNNHVSFDIERWEREKMDQGSDQVGQQQEALDQAALANFDQMDAEAVGRAQALLQAAEITRDANGNLVIPTVPTQSEAPIVEGAMEDELIDGLTAGDIYFDTTLNMHVLEVSPTEVLTGATVDEVIEKARTLNAQVVSQADGSARIA